MNRWRGLVLPLALLVIAEVAFAAYRVQSDSLAPPSAIAASFLETLTDGSLWRTTAETFGAMLAGLAIGAGGGLVVGCAIGFWGLLYRFSFITIEMLRPIPSVALLPLSLLIFGFGFRMEIAIIAFATFWPFIILTHNAVSQIEPRLEEVARVLRFGPLETAWKMVLPAAAPRLMTALRLAAGIALVVAVTTEIVSNPQGPRARADDLAGDAAASAHAGVHAVDRPDRLGQERGAAGARTPHVPAPRPARHECRGMRTERAKALLQGLAGLALVLALWHWVTASGLVPRVFLASPAATWTAIVNGFTVGETGGHFWATVGRMFRGWLLASLVAIALGSVIGISETARAYLRPILAFARSLPASAIVPVAIALVGLTPGMVLGVIVFGSVWPTLLATVQGFALVDPRLVEVSRALHMSRLAFIWKIGLPNAVPDILTGMRLSLTVSLILSVVGEMLVGQEGLGQAILLAARAFRAPDLYAGIVLLGLIGLVTSYGLAIVERRIVAWRR